MRSSHKKYIDVLEKNRGDCSLIIALFVDMDKEQDPLLVSTGWALIFFLLSNSTRKGEGKGMVNESA